MPTVVADVGASIWCYDVADGGPLRQMLWHLCSADLRKPCWKTGKSLSSTEIFFCFMRKLNLFQL